MTKDQFKDWLSENYGRGQRLAFVAHFNEVAKSLSAPPISEGAANKLAPAVNNWLTRNPPVQYDGIPFERFLTLVLERKNNPKPPAKIYSVEIALTERENKILHKTAKQAMSTPEQFLALCLRIGFENQTGLDAE